MNLQRQGESLAPEASAAVGMRTTTALTNLRQSNAASADAIPAQRTVPKTIFIAHAVPAEPRYQKKPQVAAGVDATRTARAGISLTNAPVVWHVSAPVKPEMSGDPISANGALIVRSNGAVAGLRVAKNGPTGSPVRPEAEDAAFSTSRSGRNTASASAPQSKSPFPNSGRERGGEGTNRPMSSRPRSNNPSATAPTSQFQSNAESGRSAPRSSRPRDNSQRDISARDNSPRARDNSSRFDD